MLQSEFSDIYICFAEAERPIWYMRWLKKGFSHCYIIEPYKGRWIKYEYGHGVARVDMLEDVAEILGKCIIVKHKRAPTNHKYIFVTCVSFVKLVAGISGFALTPYQLYRRLKNGV